MLQETSKWHQSVQKRISPQERINEIEQLESIAERTEEQEQLLADLKTKYKISTRRTPSISGLISALIEAETGIPVERRETKE